MAQSQAQAPPHADPSIAFAARIGTGSYPVDQLNDDLDQLTQALGELADLYEPRREGEQTVDPAVAVILAKYE